MFITISTATLLLLGVSAGSYAFGRRQAMQTIRAQEMPLQSRFLEAAWKGDLVTLEQMYTRGADINGRFSDNGATALHCAARAGQAHIVRWLVIHGADVNAVTGSAHATAADCAAAHIDRTNEVLSILAHPEFQKASDTVRRKTRPGESPL
jgi:ankyrin repeat protein